MKVAIIYNKHRLEADDVINLFGPQTKEIYHPKTVERVTKALESGGHRVKKIDGNMNVIDELRSFMPRVVAGELPGMVFNMAYGIQGYYRYTQLPAMMEMMGIPYVGSNPSAHVIALDKALSKIIFQKHNLSTPEFWVFSSAKEITDDVIYPAIVKPKMEAVSMGLRIVHNKKDLEEAVDYVVNEFRQQALVEQFIAGREFAVGILGNRDLEIFPILEIDLEGDPNAIQSQEDKLEKPKKKICPANLPEEQAREMRSLAKGAFQALGLYDFSRVDFRMDKEGKIYILEINSMASLGHVGSYVTAAGIAGYSFSALVNRMLDVAAVRYFGETYLKPKEEESIKGKKKLPLHIRLRSYLRIHLPTMQDSLTKMTDFDTYVYNLEGINTFGRWLAQRLSNFGFVHEIHQQVDVGNLFSFKNHNSDRHDLLIIGTADVSYPYRDTIPVKIDRGKIVATGVADGKGGLAVLLGALSALRFTRSLKKLKVGILLVTDSRLGFRYSCKFIDEMAKKSRFVVGLRHAEKDGSLVASCSGKTIYRIELNNLKKTVVGSTRGDVITPLCRKIISWQKLGDPKKEIVVQATSLDARSKVGKSSEQGIINLSVFYDNKNDYQVLDKKIRDIALKDVPKNQSIVVTKGTSYPPFKEDKESRFFIKKIQELAEKTELKLDAVHSKEPSVLCFVPEGVPAIGGMGPVGETFNSPYEHIVRDSLIDKATLLALAMDYCNEEK